MKKVINFFINFNPRRYRMGQEGSFVRLNTKNHRKQPLGLLKFCHQISLDLNFLKKFEFDRI